MFRQSLGRCSSWTSAAACAHTEAGRNFARTGSVFLRKPQTQDISWHIFHRPSCRAPQEEAQELVLFDLLFLLSIRSYSYVYIYIPTSSKGCQILGPRSEKGLGTLGSTFISQGLISNF